MYSQSDSCQISGLWQIYEHVFGQRTDGFFVEVGAYDGYNFSNTWGLAEAGWKGIYIEPVKEFYTKCIANHARHSNVSVYNIAIGKDNGEIELNLGGPLTSANKKQVKKVKQLAWARGVYTDKNVRVECKTLDTFLNFIEPNQPIDVLVIDVEGMEMDVLEGANLEKWNPKMIIIEAHEYHPDDVLRVYAKSINDFVQPLGYKKIYSDEINNIYIKKEE